MARSRQCLLAACAWLCVAGVAQAQTDPLAAISGHVTDPSGAPLGGVKVSATSPALQGMRESATTADGDFLIPFLPPGEYAIVFHDEGFREALAERTLRAAETSRLDMRLELAGASAAVTVTAEPASVIGESGSVGTTYQARLIDRLPVDRSRRSPLSKPRSSIQTSSLS